VNSGEHAVESGVHACVCACECECMRE